MSSLSKVLKRATHGCISTSIYACTDIILRYVNHSYKKLTKHRIMGVIGRYY